MEQQSTGRGAGGVVRTYVNSKGKIRSTGGSEEGRTCEAASRMTASSTRNRLSYLSLSQVVCVCVCVCVCVLFSLVLRRQSLSVCVPRQSILCIILCIRSVALQVNFSHICIRGCTTVSCAHGSRLGRSVSSNASRLDFSMSRYLLYMYFLAPLPAVGIGHAEKTSIAL